MDIHLSDISKTYDDSGEKRIIFKNMSASFSAGAFYAIIGKSGVGKSSLLNLISGIDIPDEGDIRVGGDLLNSMTDADRTAFRRRNIGFVYQFFNLIPVLTVLENVTLICELDGLSKKKYIEKAHELLEAVGMSDRKSDYPDKLSGGEQQRVAIVRALVNRPQIILADEPTGNLDSQSGAAVLDMICELSRQSNATLIMATHSPEAVKYADHVLRVENQQLASGLLRQM